MRGRAALALLGFLLGGAGTGRVLWPWQPGAEPFDQPGAPSSDSCGACHEAEHTQWAASRHHTAWTNDLMLVGYAAEPLEFCVNCHAPSPEAAEEIRKNRMFYASLAPDPQVPPGSVPRLPEPRAEEGIGCAVCHWRQGAILSPGPGFGPHQSVETPALRDGKFCLPCHEFTLPETVDGRTTATETLMQATGTEWKAWRQAGGTETCQDCHMPGGSHQVRGAHDRDFLRGAVTVETSRRGDRVVFTVQTQGIGHHMPSGDLFRHMTLEVSSETPSFMTIHTFGRRFEVDLEAGLPHKKLVEDTALRPGVPWTLEVPAADVQRWRLRWHDGSPRDEVRGLLDSDEIIVTLHEGRIPA